MSGTTIIFLVIACAILIYSITWRLRIYRLVIDRAHLPIEEYKAATIKDFKSDRFPRMFMVYGLFMVLIGIVCLVDFQNSLSGYFYTAGGGFVFFGGIRWFFNRKQRALKIQENMNKPGSIAAVKAGQKILPVVIIGTLVFDFIPRPDTQLQTFVEAGIFLAVCYIIYKIILAKEVQNLTK